MIESSLLFKEEDIDSREETYRWVLDNMPFSMNKLQAVADIIKRGENQSFISYIFPLLRYHDRWAYLNAQDLQSSLALEHSLKGVGLQWRSSSDDAIVNNDGICKGNCSIAAFSDDYMSRIAELCAEHGIQLVLIQPPYSGWQAEQHKQAADWAAAHQATYLDYNTAENLAATGIVFNSDFVDSGKHLNTLGAEKLSIPLGSYLANTFSLPDHRGDAAYAAWDADYAYYGQLKRAGILAVTTSLPDYLALLAEPDYIVAISAAGDASTSPSDETIAGLRALGLGADLREHPSWPYLAIIDGQEVVYEDTAEKLPTYQYTSSTGIDLAITCGASEAGSTTSIRVGRSEYARQQGGLNIVVYDKSMGKVIDSVHFDIAAPDPIAQR
ncbi:MAG: hypothetical protein LLG44_01100 [Chloroflexi bacterium]|nr:hypothetical protein [Chloroflexota bacterium]